MQEEAPERVNQDLKQKYYALFAPYGIRAVYNEHHAPKVHIFETAKARDDWVAQDDPFNPKRETVKASEARKYLQKDRDDPEFTAAMRSVIEDLKISKNNVRESDPKDDVKIVRHDLAR